MRIPALAALIFAAPTAALAAGAGGNGTSFVEDFDRLDLKRWYVSDGWANGDHQNCAWSKRQIGISDGTLRLAFEKRQAGDRDYACGEIQTRGEFKYGAYEVRMKPVAGSGLNSSLFTYIGPTHGKPHDEIDFEFLGKDPSQVQLNQYVDGVGNNEKLVDVAGGADAAFNDYAFIWEPERIRWFINGELVHTADDPAKLPQNAQKIYLALWGTDTLTGWMGRFQDEGRKVMEVDRVSFTAQGDACQYPESIVCRLDDAGTQ
ncbi:endo-1,3-1,4-beta-glycanase ExoK [Aureimonas altamirensis DSM 21988]|uniref:Beta-glucanase n=1 Tax=Aureimonas altamirensis DSM 21988 TaxID=1121026 RepID=A0ABY1INW7_9HYPH|nr:glycoside hydrolase family 16 protein [Aureimonas altamirensis]SHJ71321.1 endo-1,3-1,4-beta-glycanase ExoK [Aureimonas altamirensis DSM 21988]